MAKFVQRLFIEHITAYTIPVTKWPGERRKNRREAIKAPSAAPIALSITSNS